MKHLRLFWKKEMVLCISGICAIATMFIVPPDGEYLGYIDLRVLCLLLSLMAVVAGAQSCGVFRWLTWGLLKRTHSGRLLGVVLVLLPFFSSMLVTNDVALLVFVPFTLGLLTRLDCRRSMIPMLVLQTIAANLGSMATPVGNPQNLFLYATYELSAGAFFAVTLPLTAVSLVALAVSALPVLPRKLQLAQLERVKIADGRKFLVYAGLFVICLLTVFRVIHYGILTVIVVGVNKCVRVLINKILYLLTISKLCNFLLI